MATKKTTAKTETKTLFIAIAYKDNLVYTGLTLEEAVAEASYDNYRQEDLKVLEVTYTVPKEVNTIKTQKITLK